MLRALIHIPIYLLLSVCAWMLISSDLASSAYAEQLYSQQELGDTGKRAVKGFLETITFGWYDGGTEQEQLELQTLQQRSEAAHRAAVRWAQLLFGGSLLFLVCVAILGARQGAAGLAQLINHTLGVALIFFVAGIFAPMLTVAASQDIPALGNVVLKYESKGLLSSIQALLRSGNTLVGVMILLFSIVNPLIKLGLSFLVVLSRDQRRRQTFVTLLGAIGKWSMVDVMVVAILLAYFGTAQQELTTAWTGLGLYCFAWYCILSLLSSHLLARLVEPHPNPSPAMSPHPNPSPSFAGRGAPSPGATRHPLPQAGEGSTLSRPLPRTEEGGGEG